MTRTQFVLVGTLACILASGNLLQAETEEDRSDGAQEPSSTYEQDLVPQEAIGEVAEALTGLAQAFAGTLLVMADPVLDLAIEEMKSDWSTKIQKFDSDKNGALSRKELESIPEEEMQEDYKALSAGERKKELDRVFEEIDIDEDGEITGEEIVELVENAKQQFKDEVKNMELSPSTKSDTDSEPGSDLTE